mgnify:CR=1 FL=1|jgi:Tfp pilus assembly protein PilE
MKYTRGFGLIEIIIGAAIVSLGVLAIVNSFNTYTQYALNNQYNIQTAYLLEEGIEVMRFFRSGGWSTQIAPLSTTTTYYLVFTNGTWATTTVPQYIDGKLLRSITVSDVKRNASDKIDPAGTYDPYTKLITVTVAQYIRSATTTKTLSAYIFNI